MELKYYSQKRGTSSCGPVCLKMVFEYFGKKVSDKRLFKVCETIKGKGTSHKKMVEVSRKNGFKVQAKNESSIKEIMKYIDKKKPAIVNYINPKSCRGHYSVVKEYNSKKKELIFADPSNGNNFKMNFNDFKKRWFNRNKTSPQWMMTIEK